MTAGLPTISVVLSTRNRHDQAARAARSILLNDYSSFDFIVVDQSDDRRTEIALGDSVHDPRMQYIRTETRGLAAGRNLGLRHSRAELIAMTDDDCEVPPRWLHELASAFRLEPSIGIVLGSVLAAKPYDRSLGFIPEYVCSKPFLARGVAQKHRVEGIGACFAITREAWQSLSGFDEMLGAGARLRAAEDTDLIIKALLAGYSVLETPAFFVLHHGFRTWDQGPELIHGYLFGIGAMLTKHVKAGNWSVLQVVFRLAWRWTFSGPVVEFGYKPPRRLRLSAFMNGCSAAARTPVDKATSLFRKRR